MTVRASGLERRYRQLIRSYPAAWRRRHEDELVGVLLDLAEADARTTVGLASALDLVGHGVEERVERGLRWLPGRLRQQVAVVALVVAAGLSLVLGGGEIVGAATRLVPEPGAPMNAYFLSGPFLTIGIGLYAAHLVAIGLVVAGRGGIARLLVVVTVAYVVWMYRPSFSPGYPVPRLMILVLFAGLGLLAALGTLRPSRLGARRMLGWCLAVTGAVVVGGLLTKSVMGWSVGTITTSGNVALAVLATVLPFVGGIAILVAALGSRRRPGWAAAVAVAAFPVVVFCTLVSQSVNLPHADDRTLFPLYYLLAVAVVAVAHHRRGRRTVASG